jgi:hypothetical protein
MVVKLGTAPTSSGYRPLALLLSYMTEMVPHVGNAPTWPRRAMRLQRIPSL